jgi:hypothetical protein
MDLVFLEGMAQAVDGYLATGLAKMLEDIIDVLLIAEDISHILLFFVLCLLFALQFIDFVYFIEGCAATASHWQQYLSLVLL